MNEEAAITAPGIDGVRYVSFDLYGTLLCYGDLEGSWKSWRSELFQQLEKCGMELEAEAFGPLCRDFFARDIPAEPPLSVFETRLVQLAERLGLQLSAARAAKIADLCCEAWQRPITLHPECLETLEILGRSYPLFLISNFDHPRHVRQLLGELQLPRFFRELVISGEHGAKKPAVSLFSPLRAKYGIAPLECVHVGDSIEDYHFALNCRMVPVLLSAGSSITGTIDYLQTSTIPLPAARRISTLKELPQLLRIGEPS